MVAYNNCQYHNSNNHAFFSIYYFHEYWNSQSRYLLTYLLLSLLCVVPCGQGLHTVFMSTWRLDGSSPRLSKSSQRDQFLKHLFGEGYLPGNCLSVRWYLKMASWKIGICSVIKKVLLENLYLFGSQKSASVKSVSVR